MLARPRGARLATAAEAASSAATAAGTLFARAGFVHYQPAAVDFLIVQRPNRVVGALIVGHLDEAEAFAAAGVAIGDDLR